MRSLAAAAAIILFAEPLAAQARGRAIVGPPTRVPGRSGTGIPNGAFLDPGVIERRPLPAKLGPIPFPPIERQWVKAETEHFILISGTGEHATRAVAHDLEKLTALLTNTSTYFRTPPQRTRIFLFAERRIALPYFDAVRGYRIDMSGLTLRHTKGSTMLIDTSARGGAAFTPRHELVHDLLRGHLKPLPLWIEEGLAEYYSNAGLTVREHVSRLRGRLKMPLLQMFSTTSEDAGAWTYDYYAQSWSTVATLMRRSAKSFFELLQDIDEGTDAAAAIHLRYGMTLKDLEIAMRKVSAPAVSLLITTIPPGTLEAKPMTRGELLCELGDLLARVSGREEEAERHFRAALDADPQNGATHLAYAELLVERPHRAAEARMHAQAARPYLERAFERDPRQLDVAFPLFSLYVESGERENADRMFNRLVETTRVNDARRLLLDTEVPRADALAREGKLLEAAKVLRDLAPKMPQKTRANLEGQAVRLESLAAQP